MHLSQAVCVQDATMVSLLVFILEPKLMVSCAASVVGAASRTWFEFFWVRRLLSLRSSQDLSLNQRKLTAADPTRTDDGQTSNLVMRNL